MKKKVYGLGSKIIGGNSVISFLSKRNGIPVFSTIEEAKIAFGKFYAEVLDSEEDEDIEGYKKAILDLVNYHPVIFGIEQEEFDAVINEFRLSKTFMHCPQVFIDPPHVLIPMKKGFLDQHLVLDIVKDVEEFESYNKDGKRIIRVFHIIKKGEEIPEITEEMERNILKERKLI
jgi:hypothetical protein